MSQCADQDSDKESVYDDLSWWPTLSSRTNSLRKEMCCSFVVCIFVFFIVYKLVDRLLRIPRICNYSNRYIFVTGCDTGFGNLLAKRLDRLGCHVFAGCLTEKGETDLKKVTSDRLHAMSLDVTKQESVRKALECVKSKLPEGRGLWGLVNNAGMIYKSGPNEWMSVDDYKKQCDVNLWGPIDVSLTFLPLVKREKGRIVNMSSGAGRTSLPLSTQYSLSKYGVEAFSDGLRRDLRLFGCKVILVEPGGFKTAGSRSEVFAGSFAKAWESASQEVKDQYGQEYFDYCHAVLPNEIVQILSDKVEKVVNAYEHALLGRFPRIRYIVGVDMYLFYLPVQALPEWLSDWFLNAIGTVPIPAALRQ